MSLRWRLIWLAAVLTLVVLGTAVAVNLALSRVQDNREQVATRLQPAALASRSLLVSLIDQETGQRGFLLTGDEQFLQPYRQGGRAFTSSLARLRTTFPEDPSMMSALDRVEDSAAQWRRLASPRVAVAFDGSASPGARLVRERRSKVAFDQVRRSVAQVQQVIDTRTARAETRDRTALTTLGVAVDVGWLMVVAILLAAALFLRRWVLMPVHRLRERMQRVAGGTIDLELVVEGPVEVAAIARDAENMRRRIVSELDTARGATEALSQHSPVVSALSAELASSSAHCIEGIRVAGRVHSAEGVLAGDWWGAVPRPDGSTAVIVADVSGHGAEAGLVAFAFKQRITALLDGGLDLSQAFSIAAMRSGTDVERFLSCLVVLIDPRAGLLTWVNAGHPPGLVVGRHALGPRRELVATGPLVSSVTNGWIARQMPLGRGELLLLCTDGVIEARDADGAELGQDGVLRVLRNLPDWSAEAAVEECHAAVRRFAVNARRDDVTVVALMLTPDREPSRTRVRPG